MYNISFTIVAKNYYGLACLLRDSIKVVSPDVKFYIFIVDEIEDQMIDADENVIVCKDSLCLSHDLWDEMAFKYDITEFCTALKPLCFNYLFCEYSESKVIYFDPDIYVFSDITEIYKRLDSDFMLLTPHINFIERDYAGDLQENWLLASGVYNLGFVAFKCCDEAKKVIEWWTDRLIKYCYSDPSKGMFTDQKWMSFMPCFYDNGVSIIRDIGYNVAPWNFFEREVFLENNVYYIKDRSTNKIKDKLVFVHFSGFDYKELNVGDRGNKNIRYMKVYEDVEVLFDFYSKKIVGSRIDKYFDLKYTYDHYQNEKRVLSFHRKLYRGFLYRNVCYKNPFAVNNGTFYSLMEKKGFVVEDYLDKYKRSDYDEYKKKIVLFKKMLKLISKVVGAKNYIAIINYLEKISRPVNQTFLFDDDFNDRQIY